MTNTIPNLSQTPLPPQKCHCGKDLFITTYMSNPPQYAYAPCSCTYKIMTNDNNGEGWVEEFRKIGEGSVRFLATREEVIDYISTLLAKERENYKATLSKEIEGLQKKNKEAKPANYVEEVDERAYNSALREVLNIINK